MLRALVALVVLAAAPVALAWHGDECTPEEGRHAAMVAGVYAWVQVSDPSHVSWGFWEETNGIHGLQRYDVVFDETCHGAVPADTEIVAFYAV